MRTPRFPELADRDWMKKRYIDEMLTAGEIAERIDLECSINRVLYWLRKHDIPLRDFTESKTIRFKRKKQEAEEWTVA